MAVTKEWVSAKPKINADGNVTQWSVEYKYTDGDFSHTFNKSEKIDTPSKAPGSYTKAELLTLMDEAHWDDMFAKKHNNHQNPPAVDTVDNSFDINSLS
tara:strand:+ start:9561 stop:9857 length:297 start_codon:yes stop_codon:yes gene_type:complete